MPSIQLHKFNIVYGCYLNAVPDDYNYWQGKCQVIMNNLIYTKWA